MDRQQDHELVAAIVAGNANAFGVLLDRHGDACTRFAIRMLGSKADADDALQSAFLRAYRGLRACREPRRFRSWLMQIVVNECRSFATRRGRRAQRFVQDEAALEHAEAAPPVDELDLRDEIQRALAKVPVLQREAFILRHVEDMSYEDMAAISGVGVSAMKMRVKRACEHLRALLDGVHT